MAPPAQGVFQDFLQMVNRRPLPLHHDYPLAFLKAEAPYAPAMPLCSFLRYATPPRPCAPFCWQLPRAFCCDPLEQVVLEPIWRAGHCVRIS